MAGVPGPQGAEGRLRAQSQSAEKMHIPTAQPCLPLPQSEGLGQRCAGYPDHTSALSPILRAQLRTEPYCGQ